MVKNIQNKISGKRILLPFSRDNHAAFVFAIMGARVTLVDIGERQLEDAKTITD